MKLTELIVLCLKDKGALTAREIAQILGVNQKAVNVALGHLQRQERITKKVVTTQTPYGTYTSRSCKFALKEAGWR